MDGDAVCAAIARTLASITARATCVGIKPRSQCGTATNEVAICPLVAAGHCLIRLRFGLAQRVTLRWCQPISGPISLAIALSTPPIHTNGGSHGPNTLKVLPRRLVMDSLTTSTHPPMDGRPFSSSPPTCRHRQGLFTAKPASRQGARRLVHCAPCAMETAAMWSSTLTGPRPAEWLLLLNRFHPTHGPNAMDDIISAFVAAGLTCALIIIGLGELSANPYTYSGTPTPTRNR